MENINSRIAEIRKTLGLSMRAFAGKIGISSASINYLEKGINNPSEQTIKLICKEFNVDYFWLIEGKGEMFTAIPETLIDELVDEYKLDKYDKLIIQTYLEASDEQQKTIKDFLLTLAEKVSKESSE